MDKILVVDDMEQNVELISRYLTAAGYSVIMANNGRAALKKVKITPPDLIILDIMMPELSGYDVCKNLKANEDTKYIPILMVTALDSKDTRTRSFEVGADDFLTKSFDKTLLLSKVKSLLRIKHLSDQLKNQYAELEEKNNLLDYQLKMACEVQKALIEDRHFTFSGIEFIGKYMPTMDVGGDLFDIYTIDKDRVGILMSDVSGHGISAALLTSMMKLMFRTLITKYIMPDDLLEAMNTEFTKMFGNKLTDVYSAAFYALVDLEAGFIYYSNAGHALPIYYNSEDLTVSELEANGVPIGMMPNTEYIVKSKKIHKGDLLFFYTDGLSDSLYKNNYDEFLEKLKQTICENAVHPLEEILDLITNQFYNMDEETKHANDDVSMIITKI